MTVCIFEHVHSLSGDAHVMTDPATAAQAVGVHGAAAATLELGAGWGALPSLALALLAAAAVALATGGGAIQARLVYSIRDSPYNIYYAVETFRLGVFHS
jgi:hypothetical protein